jgi:hypothetical protein
MSAAIERLSMGAIHCENDTLSFTCAISQHVCHQRSVHVICSGGERLPKYWQPLHRPAQAGYGPRATATLR